jgi:hypothetical protein
MIRLVSVIGHGKELIPHFIKHYSSYVDEIQFVIYETDVYNNLTNEVSELIKGNDKVKIVKTIKDRIFDWEKVTQLYNFIKSKSPNDWWVIADIDEFHLYPNDDLKKLIQNCNEYGWDVVRGGFIDRIGIDGEFPEIVEEVSIWEQLPNAGFFRYPMSQACPNKICVVKGNVEITSGQHYAKIDGQTTWKWQGWNHPLINPHSFVQVHHFKWDKTCVDRIKAVADLKQTYSYSNEYSVMYESLRKNRFKINLDKTEFMFELGLIYPNFDRYTKWNKLIKKIISI